MQHVFTPGTFQTASQLQVEFDLRCAEAEVAGSFRDLIETRCRKHAEFDKECEVCRLTMGWAVFKQFWVEEAAKAHTRVLQIKNIATPQGQEEYIRATERELMYTDFYAKPEQQGSEGRRKNLGDLIRDVKRRLDAALAAIRE